MLQLGRFPLRQNIMFMMFVQVIMAMIDAVLQLLTKMQQYSNKTG